MDDQKTPPAHNETGRHAHKHLPDVQDVAAYHESIYKTVQYDKTLDLRL